ncbi:ParB/RepB/Spo0J family partition protein [Streptomyces sp. NPDC003697]
MNSSSGRVMDLPAHFTQPVRIINLAPADTPRLNGIDEAHAQRLAEVFESLPPILVHRPTMRVIDGMHRLRAASSLGVEFIDAQFFDGPEDEAFIQSVARNIAHGLPLSIADRRAAAERILVSFPAMSDRSIAVYTGLDAKTVADVRRRSAVENPQPNVRVGRDGRAHPLDRTAERRRAAELMTSRPGMPLRAVAQETGLSLGTAHDVRQRLLRGEEPVPPPGAPPRSDAAAGRAGDRGLQAPVPQAGGQPPARRPRSATARGALETLRVLAGDPSLRHSESGREFIRWLHAHFFTDEAWRRRINAIPAHDVEAVTDIAMKCSDTWRRFAEELSDRRSSRNK